jgi:hypothetical protein
MRSDFLLVQRLSRRYEILWTTRDRHAYPKIGATMPHEMLAFWASALGVAMIALLIAGSQWVQRRIRADLEKQTAVAAIDQAEANTRLKAEEATGGAQSPTSQSGIVEQRKAVVAGLPGSSARFRNPARGATVKDVMNRALGIHVFEMLKERLAPASAK